MFLFWLLSLRFWQNRWFSLQVHFVFRNCARLIQAVCFGKKEVWPILRNMEDVCDRTGPHTKHQKEQFGRLPSSLTAAARHLPKRHTGQLFLNYIYKFSLALNKSKTSQFTGESHVFQGVFQLGERFIKAKKTEFTVELQILNLTFMSVGNGYICTISISSHSPAPLIHVPTSYQGWVECFISIWSSWNAGRHNNVFLEFCPFEKGLLQVTWLEVRHTFYRDWILILLISTHPSKTIWE